LQNCNPISRLIFLAFVRLHPFQLDQKSCKDFDFDLEVEVEILFLELGYLLNEWFHFSGLKFTYLKRKQIAKLFLCPVQCLSLRKKLKPEKHLNEQTLLRKTGDHLTEIQLIEIVIFQLIETLLIS
jgi:hypothetical protein